MAIFRSTWYRLALLLMAIVLTSFWFGLGPGNPGYALMLAWGTSSLEPALPTAITRLVPLRWLRVPPGERRVLHVLGVRHFARLLDRIGWNRMIRSIRDFRGTTAGLLSLQEHARFGFVAHGFCLAIHLALAVCALFTSHPLGGALWMLAPAVVVHLYPALLQRFTLLRIQPLLDRAMAAREANCRA